MKCTNPKCRYEWEYKGKSKFYVTCPMCYNKVRIQEKTKEKQETKEKEPLKFFRIKE